MGAYIPGAVPPPPGYGGPGYPAPGYPPPLPDHGYPPVYPQAAPPRKSHLLAWLIAAAGVIVLLLSMVTIAALSTPRPAPACKGPCPIPPPPQHIPLGAQHEWKSTTFGYRIQYSDRGLIASSQLVHEDGGSISWSFHGFPFGFQGEQAAGRGPQKVAQDLLAAKFGSPRLAYQMAVAGLGYNPGYGAVYDINLRSAQGQSARGRLIMVTSVKNNVAVTLFGIGLYKHETQGHPNPSETPMGHWLSPLVNALIFAGDPPL